jgi:hypothetical protein
VETRGVTEAGQTLITVAPRFANLRTCGRARPGWKNDRIAPRSGPGPDDRKSPTRSPDARRRGSESGRADPGSRTPEIGRTRQSAGAPSRRHRDERFLGERSSGQLLEPPQRATPPFHARIHAIAEGSRSGSARQKEQSLGGSGAVATRPLAGVARTARMHQEHQSRSGSEDCRFLRCCMQRRGIVASASSGFILTAQLPRASASMFS